MSNHIHIQIETKDHSISQIMQHLLTLYSKYYNNKYNLVGHVFQGRYHAEIIENEAYLLQTSRYIHLNPVKAKMVEKPIDYPWSSYTKFMDQKKWNLVNDTRILNYFPDNCRKQYKEYVERKIPEEDISTELIKFEALVEKE